MCKFPIKHNSIMMKIFRLMLVILILQAIVFAMIITWGSTIKQTTENSFDILNERVISRKNYLENEMTQRWSNLLSFEEYVKKELKVFLENDDLSNSSSFLEKISENLVILLRQHNATGIFIVLDDAKDENKAHSGIYIRDMDPLFNSSDNSDLLLERGSSTIARKIGASLNSRWLPKFNLPYEDQASSFYYKPFLAAKEAKNILPRDLGYWSRPFRLSGDDIEVITYSIPLVNEYGGEPYGVIGLDLSIDYLRKMLNYDELANNKKGSYLLAIGDEGKMEFENIISSGPMHKRIIGTEATTRFNDTPEYKDIFVLDENKQVENITYGAIQYLNIYNRNTPFENDKWALIGIVSSNELLKDTKQLKIILIFSFFIQIIIGLIGVIIASRLFTKPITNLINQMRGTNPNNSIVLEKIDIIEIDQLSSAIEYLSNKVADSASRLSRIIEMVNMPIGAFEYIKGEKEAFCTKAFFEILGIKKIKTESGYIDFNIIMGAINNIKKNVELDLDDVYRVEVLDGSIRWIRLITQEDEIKMLGIIEDVTEKTLDKRKIEYERDHDLLTNLINRRAFHQSVGKKLLEENIKVAAFIMWDLDNLKYINDIYGHDYGDLYIKTAANVLSEFTVYNGIVARMSGDEFYVFLYGYHNKEDLRYIINMMMSKLNETELTMPDGDKLKIRASAGIAWYPDDSENYEDLIKYADFAMYEIKNTVKGNIGEFNKKNYRKDSFLLYGKEQLNHFIEEELIRFAFQPIIDAKTGEIFAYEALMRPQLDSLKSPIDILRLAHSQSKLYEIERITWFKVMETFEKLKDSFGEAKIFVNSIPNHILSDKDLLYIENKYGDNLERIVIEIIENEQINERITKKKQQIARAWNCELALDDFGSGYNSEIALLILTPCYIKIDMIIIRDIDKDINRQKLLQNIISYAKGRHIKIIAEGVETKEEMDTVISFGVDYIQGYYIGKPSFKPGEIEESVVREIRGE